MMSEKLKKEIEKLIKKLDLEEFCTVETFRDCQLMSWWRISYKEKLSEEFIREFQDKVFWIHISIYQKLSEAFIKEFAHKVDWEMIMKHQKLSKQFKNEIKGDLTR